jgi:hypothetical protein
MAYTYIEAEINLEDFSDEELIEEIKHRKIEGAGIVHELEEQITSIWMKRRLGKDYQKEIDELIYNTIGKLI